MFIYIALKFLKYKKFFEEDICENENVSHQDTPCIVGEGQAPARLFNIKMKIYG